MWKINDRIAAFEFHGVCGKIDLSVPGRGVATAISQSRRDCECSLFRIVGPSDAALTYSIQLSEFHVRGNDCIASYVFGPTHEFSLEIKWRLIELSGHPSMEFILSIQTQRLDSYPMLSVESSYPPAELHLSMNANRPDSIYLTWPGLGNAIVEMAPIRPTSGPSVSNEIANGRFITCSRWGLVDEPMEKGVIRTIRLVTSFLASQKSDAELSAMYDEYLRSEPPLTA